MSVSLSCVTQCHWQTQNVIALTKSCLIFDGSDSAHNKLPKNKLNNVRTLRKKNRLMFSSSFPSVICTPKKEMNDNIFLESHFAIYRNYKLGPYDRIFKHDKQ